HDEKYMPAEIVNMQEAQNFCEPLDSVDADATDGAATSG
ncbi:MAG: cytochrome c biogenesis protein CcmE, partial [Octadecabacter sp.]